MEEIFEIIDPNNGKERKIVDLKIVEHELPDADGVIKLMKCVEFVVVGRNRRWPNWVEYNKFMEMNSSIKI